MLGTIAVFLSAYDIPVTFHTLMSVTGGNSIANMTSVTPGGAGVVQSFNALSLRSVTSATNATAYSVAQQLVETAWSIALAIVLLVRAFGWSGGKALVGQSYTQAKEKAAEETRAARARPARGQARRRGSAPERERTPRAAVQPAAARDRAFRAAAARPGPTGSLRIRRLRSGLCLRRRRRPPLAVLSSPPLTEENWALATLSLPPLTHA